VPRSISLIARDPDGILADEPFTEVIEDQVLDQVTKDLNIAVVDEQFRDRNGLTARRWVGTPEQLAACAAVNPLSARLFSIADRVFVRGQWRWVRKSDGRFLEWSGGR